MEAGKGKATMKKASCKRVRTPSGTRCLCTGPKGGFAKMSRCKK